MSKNRGDCMIAGLANIIADFFINKEWAEEEDREIYQYGSEVIIATSLNVFIVVVCGLLFYELMYISIFYIAFLLLRSYCGGYHAETHLKCNTIFTANIITVLIIIKNVDLIQIDFIILAMLVSSFIVWTLSPIINKNKPLTEEETKKYRRISLIITIVVDLSILGFIAVDMKTSVVLSLALLSVSGAMIVEKITRQEV